jgi:hypothetical protein
MDVFNMLNTKYFIARSQDGPPYAQRNPGALGNAWFVDEYLIAENADKEIAALDTVNPAITAIIDQRFGKQLEGFSTQKDSLAFITFEEYKPNYLKYTAFSNTPQMAIFSEVYYDKGWNAYIDGKLSPHFRANYILRGMIVPEGEHTIEFRFEPKTFRTAEKTSFAFSILVYLMLTAAIGFEVFRAHKKKNDIV